MKKAIYVVSIFLIVPFLMGFTWKAANKVREANRLFDEEKYADALTKYNDAQIDTPNSAEIYFNMGNVFYRMKKYDEAINSYRKAMERGDITVEAKACYNIGNALFRQGRLKESLDTYKQALGLDPDDVDMKYNIELTEKMIKEMLSRSQETMQQAAAERDEKEKEQEGQEREGEKSTETGEEKEEGETQEGADTGKAGEEEKGEGVGERKELTEDEAERILTALEEREKMPSDPARMQKSSSGYEYGVEKDW